MCGLVGVISKYSNGFTQKQKDIFSTLLFVDTLRGEDSTGAFLVTNKGDLKMIKDSTHALDFITNKEYDTLLSEAFSRGAALVGHNRKATKGTISPENAHPFLVDDKICLVHNGTLWGDHKKHADVEVDSHAIAHLLAQHDVEGAISKIDGAYALIWHDFETDTLNFLRNSQRPLHWAETDNEYIWASEMSMLEFVRYRYDLKFTQTPVLLPEDVLATFKLDIENGGWDADNRKLTFRKEYNYQAADYHACAWSFGGEEEAYNNIDSQVEQEYLASARAKRWRERAQATSSTHVAGNSNIVSQQELEQLSKTATLVPVGDWEYINVQYKYSQTMFCKAIDCGPVNGVDGSAGYFLYLQPLDDTDIIVRYRYGINTISEEKLLQMAINSQHFKVTVGQKSWHSVEGHTTKEGSKLGICMINASFLELIPNIFETTKTGEVIVH